MNDYTVGNNTTRANLPQELTAQARFFSCYIAENGTKVPVGKGWSEPANQKKIEDVTGKLIGFDTAGHGLAEDYCLIDFDHVLDDTGNFCNEDARKWYAYFSWQFDGDFYCERSISGHGLHIICKPTPGKFGKITNNETGGGLLLFDEATQCKIEVFFKTAGRYVLLTGDLFNCKPQARIPAADEVDEALENFLRLTHYTPPAPITEYPDDCTDEVKALKAAINRVSLEEVVNHGLIEHSEKGAPSPLGYICPECGSGTHVHKTGALQFNTTPSGNYVYCHKCNFNADVIGLVGMKHGLLNSDGKLKGKNFYDALRIAAQTFAIPFNEDSLKQLPKKTVPPELALTDEQKEFLFSGDFSDVDNARRVAYFYADKIRCDKDNFDWYTFEDGCWKNRGEKNSVVTPLISELADRMIANAKDKDQLRFGLYLRKRNRAADACYFLRGEPSILIRNEDLDVFTYLLNCKNGVVDLQTGDFVPHTPAVRNMLLTQQCNAEYHPDAQSDVVDKFFEDIMPDEETRAGLLRWLGYCLTGETAEEKFAIWTGSGQNGKGTLAKLYLHLLGSYGTGLATRAFLKTNRYVDADKATTALNCLEKSRFAISEELPLDAELDCSTVKNFTGGDYINLRRNYSEYRTINPTFKLNFSGNYLPRLENVHDGGILRRLINFSFDVKFGTPEHPADPELKKKLFTPDSLNALLTKLVHEARIWYNHNRRSQFGLIISPAMREATRQHLSQNDFVQEFIDENYIFAPQAQVKVKDFITELKAQYPRETARFKRADLIRLICQNANIYCEDDSHLNSKVFKGIGKAGAESE